jgi:hypothetical protein
VIDTLSKLSQFFSERQKESIEDLSVELSHGSGTCLPQESKGSGTRSGSKAETNDEAASTSRSKSIQPNNLIWPLTSQTLTTNKSCFC